MQLMFMVVVEVSQGLGSSGELWVLASWMEERAPSAWAANATDPLRSSSFFTGLGADAEADHLKEFSRGESLLSSGPQVGIDLPTRPGC